MPKKEEDHRRQILRELTETPTLRIGDMARTRGVSTEAIRCDLDELTYRGVLSRAYGGVVQAMNSEPTVTERHRLFTKEHECIVRDVVHCMHEDKVFMIGSGTTTVHVARRVVGELRDITVIIHAFGVTTVLSMNPTIRAIVAPGEYCATEGAMTGTQMLQFLSQLTADYTLLGASSTAVDGPSEALIDSGTVYRAMIQRAVKSIVVADHSKLDLAYPYHYAGRSGINHLITDQPLPDRFITVLGREKVAVARDHATPEQQWPAPIRSPLGKVDLDPLLQIILGVDGWVPFLRPKDLNIFTSLAEKHQVVTWFLIFMRQRVSHPVEVRRRLVVAPVHQYIANIAGDHLLARFNAGPLLAFVVFTGTNLQFAPTGMLEQQRQAVKIGMRADPPRPLLRLLDRIVTQHTQDALIGVTLRIVCGGGERFRRTRLQSKAGENLYFQLPAS